MTAFTFQLALLFFPGIICGLIVEQLAVQGKWDAFRFVLYCFILGLASYLLYALVTNAWYCRWPTRLPLIHSVRHPKHIIFGDVLWATVAAVPLAFLITLAETPTFGATSSTSRRKRRSGSSSAT